MRSKFTLFLTLLLALVTSFSFAQEKTITGNVTSASDGLPLPGVSVVVQGTSRGTQTDFDGNYSINASSSESLVFSYLGLKTQTISVGGKTTINVVLEEDAEALEEVVVTGYSTVKKESVTAAQTTVTAETIENVPIPALDQVLQGQVAGLSVNAGSGQPGASGTIILRGRSSFNPNANIEPLFIIDGVPVDEDNFRSINSNDIENLTVLKDASASAIYGNRGANGVIIVTTKRGSFNQPLSVTYRSQYGFTDLIEPNINFLSSSQFLTYQRDLGAGAGNGLSDAEIAQFGRVNTNWQDFLLRQGKTFSQELTFSGGGENSRSFSSIQYFEQEGTSLRSKLQRISLRSNLDARSDKLTFSTNISLNFTRNDFVVNGAAGGGSLDNPFLAAFISLPYYSPFNPDGSLNITGLSNDPITGAALAPTGFQNTPYVTQNTNRFNTNREDEIRAVISVSGKYQLTDNVSVGTNVGVDYTQESDLDIISPTSLRGIANVPNPTAQIRGSRREATQRALRVNWSNNITYTNTFNDKHNLEVGAFTEYFKQQFRDAGFTGFGIDPRLPNSILGLTSGQTADPDGTTPYVPTLEGRSVDLGLFSVFGLVRYGYDGKYNIEANIRRDASSRFSSDNEWGTFFSVSGRWNITKEDWLSDSTWIDNLALRAGYGEVGNQDIGFGQANIFATRDLFSSGTGYAGNPGVFPFAIGNPDLRWETKKSINVGLDFGFMKGRLSGSLDVYQEDTEDILLSAPISATSGFTTILRNLGELRNTGVEFAMSYDVVQTSDLVVNLFANTAYNKNEVISIDGEQEFVDRGLTQSLSVGDPFGSFFDVRYAGVNPANGRPLFLDVDGNVTEQFSLDNRVILDKTRDPEFSGGFGLNVTYKGFGLTSLFSYATNVWRNNGTLAVVEDPSLVGIANQSTRVLDRWTQPGDITDIPDPQFFNRFADGTRYLEDSSFLRLRNVTLGYTFNSDQLKNHFKSIQIYVQAQNLVTWSKWRGFDPEDNDAGSFFDFPVGRTFTLGFDINF
ncbi:SusC/RagA family TonB-linked outer membrane protein [Spongiivirga sp. MCCC 1A20706]|uniref:SusC/RagA family TonB-linked outer membrane protein n=1 Tax=Spongiivirga sp. MCCC 1A20706 TaxID=3160963 RepID=UPI0039775542